MLGKMKERFFDNKDVHVKRYVTGHKSISIHGFSLDELKHLAALLELKLSRHNKTFWVDLPTTRNKIKVTLFAGGDA